MRELAARRVHQGVSLDDFVPAYRVALLADLGRLRGPGSAAGGSLEAASFALARFGDRCRRHPHHSGCRGVPARRNASARPERPGCAGSGRAPHPRPTDEPRPAAPGRSRPGPCRIVADDRRYGRAGPPARPMMRSRLARDALEAGMSLGTARPLAAIRHGELVILVPGGSLADHARPPARDTGADDRQDRRRRPLRRRAFPREASQACSRHTVKPRSRSPTPQRPARSCPSTSCRHSNAR